MIKKRCPGIDLKATGLNIYRLREERGYSVTDLQEYFGFSAPQAIYKWQNGQSLPTVDNLLGLSELLETPVEKILVPLVRASEPGIIRYRDPEIRKDKEERNPRDDSRGVFSPFTICAVGTRRNPWYSDSGGNPLWKEAAS